MAKHVLNPAGRECGLNRFAGLSLRRPYAMILLFFICWLFSSCETGSGPGTQPYLELDASGIDTAAYDSIVFLALVPGKDSIPLYTWVKGSEIQREIDVPLAAGSDFNLLIRAYSAGRLVKNQFIAVNMDNQGKYTRPVPITPLPESLGAIPDYQSAAGERLTVKPPISRDGLEFEWIKNGSDIVSTDSVLVFESFRAQDSGLYKLVIRPVLMPEDSLASNPFRIITVKSMTVVVLKQDLEANYLFPLGKRLLLQVLVSGPNPEFAWFRDGKPLAGEIGNFYIKENISPEDSGVYHVTVTNSYMSVPVQSSLARVSVAKREGRPVFVPWKTSPEFTNQKRPTWSWISGGGAEIFSYKICGSGFECVFSPNTRVMSFTPKQDLKDGMYTLQVREMRTDGSWSEATVKNITVDTEPPPVPVFVAAGTDSGLINNPWPKWTWEPSGQGGYFNYWLLCDSIIAKDSVTSSTSFRYPSALPEGKYYFYMNHCDFLRNCSELAISVVQIDLSAPGVLILSPANGHITSQPVIPVIWTVDGKQQPVDSAALNEGNNVIIRSGADSAGNTAYDTVMVIRDTDPPARPIIHASGRFTKDPLQSISWESGGGGRGEFFFTLTGAGYMDQNTVSAYKFLPDSGGLDNGKYKFTLKERDEAGNWSQEAVYNFTLDTEAPRVKITGFSEKNVTVCRQPLYGTVEDDTAGSGVKAVTWELSGAGTGSGAGIFKSDSFYVDGGIVLRNEGTAIIHVHAEDSAGNIGTDTVSITLDMPLPVISFLFPSPGDTLLESPLTIKYSVDYGQDTGSVPKEARVELPDRGQYNTVIIRDTNYAGEESVESITVFLIGAPVITTVSGPVESRSARCGGDITDIGGAEITARGVCWNTSPNPTIADNSRSSASSQSSFQIDIKELEPLTRYYARAYAVNQAGTGYGNQFEFTTGWECGYPYTDVRDGQSYRTVEILGRCFTAENMRFDPPETWAARNSWCYDNDTSLCTAEGRLYDWATTMNLDTSYNLDYWSFGDDKIRQGICPEGWHIMNREEAISLSNISADSLKSTGGWNEGNNGRDVLGFTALPAGHGWMNSFYDRSSAAYFWSPEELAYPFVAAVFWITSHYVEVWDYFEKESGVSVRCVKD